VTTRAWWQDAVVYLLYLRSYADSDGDGIGDLPGATARLGHLADLGVDAVWLTPFYRSPMVDHGYDVADYFDVDPLFGTLADVDALLAEAHRLGLRVLTDLVPNHTSDQHPWFLDPATRDRYVFRPPAPDGGPPNAWGSVFGGPAWTRHPCGDYYLHLFAPEQPDLDWTNPAVEQEWERILRFWLDRGVDGFRIDVAHGLWKHLDSPDGYWDCDETPALYEPWRRLVDGYGDRLLVGEVFLEDLDRVQPYVGPTRMHQAFNFLVPMVPFEAGPLREVLQEAVEHFCVEGTSPTWVLSNHDLVRHPTRYGGGRLGVRRGLALTSLLLGLPGSPYLYQGEELGLQQVDVPPELQQDPAVRLSGGRFATRDGCRTPLPWTAEGPGHGFTTGSPWLPIGGGPSVAEQADDPASTLASYRSALALRRRLLPELGQDVRWLDLPDGLLGFTRRLGEGVLACVLNAVDEAVAVPLCGEVLLDTSHGEATAADGGLVVPAAATVWLRQSS
jgi:alpha-glucosidase